MQLEITNATQKCKTEYKYANRNIKMICKTRTKQNKMIVGAKQLDDAHVGATSPSLGCYTSW